MKFYKSNSSNSSDLNLIKLKVLTTVEEENPLHPDGVSSIDYNLEFEIESIKGITMVKEDSKSECYQHLLC